MDNLDTTNQTTDDTSVDTQPINNSTPVDNTQVTNENTTIPVNSSGTTSDNTTTETPKVEPTTGDNSTTTPVGTTPSGGDGTTSTQPSEETTPIDNKPAEIPNYIEVYDYDENGYYIGVDIAERSPLDKDVVYLPPANSTKEKPPDITLGKIQKWNGKTWDIVDRPNNVVINDEINKNNDEKLKNLEIKINEQQKKIDYLQQLVDGLIITGLNVNEGGDTVAK